jgi:hypothetical protein|tara:strand:- start:265 stop:732 length:468 start_codon:yes stop_codon:yes gene_type:complete
MMEMAKSTYWDESEFGFFETLEDEDKLLYLYDLLIGEFAYMEIHNEGELLDEEERKLEELFQTPEEELGIDDEDNDIWDFEEDRNVVKVAFEDGDEGDIIKITGPTLDVILKVSGDMQMNGMIFTDRNVFFTKYEPWSVVVTYKLIGQGPPTSLN